MPRSQHTPDSLRPAELEKLRWASNQPLPFRKVCCGSIAVLDELLGARGGSNFFVPKRIANPFPDEALMRLVRSVGPCALLFAVAGCQPRVETTARAQSGEAEIRARSRVLVAAELRKDLEALMPFYADSAVIHVAGEPAIRGHAAIRRSYAEMFGRPVTLDSVITTDLSVARSGELAYETGVNHVTVTAGDQRTLATSKYLAVWRRRPDGVWVIANLAVTSNQRRTR